MSKLTVASANLAALRGLDLVIDVLFLDKTIVNSATLSPGTMSLNREVKFRTQRQGLIRTLKGHLYLSEFSHYSFSTDLRHSEFLLTQADILREAMGGMFLFLLKYRDGETVEVDVRDTDKSGKVLSSRSVIRPYKYSGYLNV
jgi:hypothetical protein